MFSLLCFHCILTNAVGNIDYMIVYEVKKILTVLNLQVS